MKTKILRKKERGEWLANYRKKGKRESKFPSLSSQRGRHPKNDERGKEGGSRPSVGESREKKKQIVKREKGEFHESFMRSTLAEPSVDTEGQKKNSQEGKRTARHSLDFPRIGGEEKKVL